MPPAAAPTYTPVDEWVARDAIPFSLDATEQFNAAVDRMVASLGEGVQVVGFGEPLHGGEAFLVLRNRLFDRLVTAHGYTAIAIESSFPRGHLVNEYATGRGPALSYDDVCDAGFSHGFGPVETSRELVEWMRRYNADAAHPVKLRFYGFDSPTEMTGTESPRRLLHVALDYLDSINDPGAPERRKQIDALLGDDAAWQDPAAMMDPTKSVGLSPEAAALRIETEELLTALRVRGPELVAKDQDGDGRYEEAVQHLVLARGMLTYHAGLARQSPTRVADLLGQRDLMMADNLAYIAARERRRGGKVLAFAHNSHLKSGRATWQLGPHALAWWPAGAHLRQMLGAGYRVIGSGLGDSEANGIGRPEPGTLEARLTAAPGPGRFIATRGGHAVAGPAIRGLPVRSGSTRNHSYFPFTADSLNDFDVLAVLDSTTYTRGARPLP